MEMGGFIISDPVEQGQAVGRYLPMNATVMIHFQGTRPDPGHSVVGNGLRALQLGESLRRHGVDVTFLVHQRFYAGRSVPHDVHLYGEAADFLNQVREKSPSLLVCIQGEGLEFLPEEGLELPVLADWIAPRMLEFAFQRLPLERWLPRLTSSAARADYHSCCTPSQRAFLYGFLQLAGFDLTEDPTLVVPLSTSTEFALRPARPSGEPVFVAGGVSWPWIRSGRFLRMALEEMEAAGRGRLRLFGGKYPFPIDSDVYGAPEEELPSSSRLELCGMLPYDRLQEEYLAADVALDLFEENPERRLALSFREIDYLRAGLPLVCGSFSHVAPLVKAHGAGWVLEDLSEETVRSCLRSLIREEPFGPGRTEAAHAVIREHFDQDRTIEPVLELLGRPRKARRQPTLLQSVLGWAEHGRVELERALVESRSHRQEKEDLARRLDESAALATRMERDLSESRGLIQGLQAYIEGKERDLSECLHLLTEKERHLLAQAEEGERLREYIAAKERDLAGMVTQRERDERSLGDLQAEKERLEARCADLQSRLEDVTRRYQKLRSFFPVRILLKLGGR